MTTTARGEGTRVDHNLGNEARRKETFIPPPCLAPADYWLRLLVPYHTLRRGMTEVLRVTVWLPNLSSTSGVFPVVLTVSRMVARIITSKPPPWRTAFSL